MYIDRPVELFGSLKEKIDPPPSPEFFIYYFLCSLRSRPDWGGGVGGEAGGRKGPRLLKVVKGSGRTPSVSDSQGASLPVRGPPSHLGTDPAVEGERPAQGSM